MSSLLSLHCRPAERPSFYSGAHDARPNQSNKTAVHRLLAAIVGGQPNRPIGSKGESPAAPEFLLTDTCPASFELHDGGCVLRSRYKAYRSLRDAGVGGLKTGLPPLREGFTPQQIDLGRYLFFDPVLSADGSVSCASCHDPAQGLPMVVPKQLASTGTPSPLRTELMEHRFFDAAMGWLKNSLEEQMQGPLYSPLEMGNNPAQLLETLNGNHTYRALFEQAFGTDTIALDHILYRHHGL
ncbi:MAG: hypothetical protein CM15mP103_02130 [Gammaproteobacteria bacterium]|nr:MAG: hypothetical protein CM15mP103_02130 [Gammaproteobacteria bacterium]